VVLSYYYPTVLMVALCYSVAIIRLCVCLLVCIVAKLRAVKQKLAYYSQRTYRKSYMRNRLVPKSVILTFAQRSLKVMSIIASHSHGIQYLGNR